MTRVLLFMFVLATTVYAAVDCINAEEEDRRGLPRGLWLILIIMLPIFGPVSWYLISSSQRRARLAAGGSMSSRATPSGGGYGRPPQRPQRPSRPVAPDDDPDFLWRLEQAQRKAAREEREAQGENQPEQTGKPERKDSDDDAPNEEPPTPAN